MRETGWTNRGNRYHWLGIMTDKDLAFRVVAEGLDVRNTLIAQVMTKVLYTCCYSAFVCFLCSLSVYDGQYSIGLFFNLLMFSGVSLEPLLRDNRYQCYRCTQQDGQRWIPSFALLECGW